MRLLAHPLAWTYLPHLTVFPLVYAWQAGVLSGRASAESWVPTVFLVMAVGATVPAWVVSSVIVGRPMAGCFTRSDWNRLRRWWRDFTTPRHWTPAEENRADCMTCLTAIGLLACGGLSLSCCSSVAQDPLASALYLQVFDLVVLTAALSRHGALADLRARGAAAAKARAEREKAETERRAKEGGRWAAVDAVRAFYTDHADLLRGAYPALRFEAELRVRIPDAASPEDAWKAARDLIAELQTAADAERKRRERKEEPRLPYNPPPGSFPNLSDV